MLTVYNNIPNTTDSQTVVGEYTLITVTCDDGFIFDGIPTVIYSDMWDNQYENHMEVSEDGKTATFSDTDEAPFYKSCDVHGKTKAGEAPPETDPFTIVNNIDGVSESHTFDGTVITITLTGTTGNKRLFSPTCEYQHNGESVIKNFDVDNDGITAHTFIDSFDENTVITVRGLFVYGIPTFEDFTLCSGTVPPYYKVGDVVELTLTSNDGCKFETENPPHLNYIDEWDSELTPTFAISADGKTATISHNLPTSFEVKLITIIAVASSEHSDPDKYGSINVYKVDSAMLKQFSEKRFYAQSPNMESIDLGVYVHSIKRIFCNIPTVGTGAIKCGNYNTEVMAGIPETDTLTLDFGNVVIPSYNGDNTDYNTEIKLFLPFAGFTVIPNDYVGEVLNLTYIINVITGNGVAIVSHNGTAILTQNVSPNISVIYRTLANPQMNISEAQWNENQFAGLTPYVVCRWFETANKPDMRNTDYKRVIIGDCNGFNRFTDVTPITVDTMLANEQNAIYNALQSGVFIV